MKKEKVVTRKEDIKDFIGIYDGYIDETLSKKAIDIFFKAEKFDKTFVRQTYHAVTKNIIDDNTAVISRDNVHEFLSGEIEFITINFKQALDHYLKETAILEYHKPFDDLLYTEIKIQKTSPGQGYHAWHVERKHNDHSASRLLAFTIYLNEVEGGETEFLYHKIRVKPKVGRIVIWPATFPYIHRGNPPLNKDKFIVTSWMLLK